MNADSPDFFDLQDVLELHALQLYRYGGAEGRRGIAAARPAALRQHGMLRLPRLGQ